LDARFIDVTLEDPYYNLAVEEALFRLNRRPTLRVWDNQLSVVIGRAQLARFETDLTYCENHQIPIVRRFTAGGAVYNGPGNVNWSFLATPTGGHDRIRYSRGPRDVFASFASMVVEALARCSVACRYVPPNSIECPEGKISGMAAYLSREGLICHGTLLLAAELDEVTRLTRPVDLVVEGKYPRSSFVRVANAGIDRQAFVQNLREAAGLECEADRMTEEEMDMAQRLRKRYRSREWNLGDPFALDDS
jgi:lipoate-protein ligase A